MYSKALLAIELKAASSQSRSVVAVIATTPSVYPGLPAAVLGGLIKYTLALLGVGSISNFKEVPLLYALEYPSRSVRVLHRVKHIQTLMAVR